MRVVKDKNHVPTNGYVGAYHDRNAEKVVVWERGPDGVRVPFLYDIPYYFYVSDNKGKYETIFGDQVSKVEFNSDREFRAGLKKFKHKFESDFSPLDRVLMDYYYGVSSVKMHYAFLDIEVDYTPDGGFPSPSNCYAPVNAITIYKQWKDEYVCIGVPPPKATPENTFGTETWPETISLEEFDSDVVARLHIVKDEKELLELTFKELENADCISGWNSDFFDLPYLIIRSEKVFGMPYILKDMEIFDDEEEVVKKVNGVIGNKGIHNKWCFEGAGLPEVYTVEKFGSQKETARISGRNHLDYLRLFQKFTFEGRESYSLAAIAEAELDIPKLDFEETLYDLYRNQFANFLKYNIRDVEVIHRLDDKFKFINLAGMMSRENTVLLETVLGTVKYVETGISNYAHRVLGKVVGNKPPPVETEKVEGAIVITPRIGLYQLIGSVDLSSLYPSTIRSINISPEKIIGQFEKCEKDWRGVWTKDDKEHTLILESGDEITMTGAEWSAAFKEYQWAISGYGTVFDQSSGKGLIPIVLEDWYNERKQLQKEKKKWTKICQEFIDAGTKGCKEYLDAKIQEEYYDLLQLTRKIQLNSTYGALLNRFFRFFRMVMGASVTATGRQITTYMIGSIGELLTGKFSTLKHSTVMTKDGIQHVYETPEDSPVIYGDTDSSYFLTYATTKEEAVETADLVAEGINARFPGFMKDAFNCQEPHFHNLISAGREIVGIRGLFQAKKKYMIRVVDMEGFPCDKLKSMGSEIKKADTPKVIRNFLKDVVDLILDGKEYDDLESFVNTKRVSLFSKHSKNDIVNIGVARSVNNLESQYDEFLKVEKPKKGKVRLPGHVRAAINYNELIQVEEKGAKIIQSGDKVKVYYLKKNDHKLKSIAFPADTSRFPTWFEETFKVDIKLTETKMIDAKLEGIFEALGKEVPTIQGAFVRSLVEF